jgi:hypothetical protein
MEMSIFYFAVQQQPALTLAFFLTAFFEDFTVLSGYYEQV